MAECCYCTDPKGDILCEKCADELYERDDIDDDEVWEFGVMMLALAFAAGLALGCGWGRWTALLGW
jgi:hypothetical protein